MHTHTHTHTHTLVQVFSFMKDVVVRNFKDQERIEASMWMQGT